MTNLGETIAAIATPYSQQGSIGIVRVSGEEAITIARTLFSAPGKQEWATHRILYGYIRHPQTLEIVDEALLLPMLAPRSFTREDIVEFHCHGGIMPVQQVLQLCLEQGARLAQPGEFTLRAFLNGRIDLTQAESVAELVSSRSKEAAKIALGGLQGKLAHPMSNLRRTCVDILAEVEARIDFEEDLPPLNEKEIRGSIGKVLGEVKAILATANQGELLREGLKVAIVGRPNVGKSSLLNAWSKSDRAIVTPLPGTTRDIVESELVVGGIPIRVLDTAGMRETVDMVEQMGVSRSRHAATDADLVLLTIDATTGWICEDEAIYQEIKHRPLILVINKIDLAQQEAVKYPPEIENTVKTAALHCEGIESLEKTILQLIHRENIHAANLDLAINQRQAAALRLVQIALERVQDTINNQFPLDFWTIDLRSAILILGEITGEDATESVLERIFSR
ncbi:MAG: tRNA uridine-5-carboxymethylaminomethyl(34) synthesis GTPase MnmE, partial [Prochloron sp. SP5CPC1]|nr:tRNA uridine-5-carboxymethylaminomethyl(34) synthesis GTPase MnmE [Candidatus Paraprochloron terpiosi SP5CPC1]